MRTKRASAKGRAPATKANRAKAVKGTKEYVGIIDTCGLDSFAPLDNKHAWIFNLRAQSNPQRHACVFIAIVPARIDVMAELKKMKDPWDMWWYLNVVSKQIKCDPEDAKTVENIKLLADTKTKLTGKAY